MISRRVRQLSFGHRPLVQISPGTREADIALAEIIDGKLTFESTFGKDVVNAPVVQFPERMTVAKKAPELSQLSSGVHYQIAASPTSEFSRYDRAADRSLLRYFTRHKDWYFTGHKDWSVIRANALNSETFTGEIKSRTRAVRIHLGAKLCPDNRLPIGF